MSSLFSSDDTRDQIEIDNELPVTYKLACGAISGATAQSSKTNLLSFGNVHPYINSSIPSSIHHFIHLLIHLSIDPSIHSSVNPITCLSIHSSINSLTILHSLIPILSIRPFIHPSIHRIHPLIH